MQYQVLARKWRPQNFHEIVGQEHVSRTLLNALAGGRVAHAFLFSGPRGSGKTTTARILAKALNCRKGEPGEPCGVCEACQEIAAGNCIDVLEIDAASNTGVDNVRDLIEQIQYRPARDRHKIFIIDEVHMLSNAAFNALLKTLEEPPAHVVFVMATTEYHKIPATILSRCQQYGFKLIKYPLILERLRHIAGEEKVQISTAALEQIAFSSGGSMRDAMSAFDQVLAFSGDSVRDEDVTMLLGLVQPAVLGDTVRAVSKNDIDKVLKIVAELVEDGQDLQNFCRQLLGQFRNLMVLKAGVGDPAMLGVPESLVPDLRQQAEMFSREDLLRLFDAFVKVEADLKYATQVRFELEMGLIELAHISRLRALEELIADFSALLQGGADEGAPAAPGPAKPAVPAPAPAPAAQAPAQAFQPPARPAPDPEPPVAESKEPWSGTAGDRESRDLLLRIAGRVRKHALEAVLQSLAGAEVQANTVVLKMGARNEFYRRQITENLALIARAAAEVLGGAFRVVLREDSAPDPAGPAEASPPPADARGKVEALERAKREPIVKSFLDVFPGPVKAEDLD